MNLNSAEGLPKPHGGRLVDRRVREDKAAKLMDELKEFPRIEVRTELAFDIENIAEGTFSPLEGFLVREDYLSVLREGRLSNGLPWTIPILLDVSRDEIKGLQEGDEVALVDKSSTFMALLQIEDIYEFDKNELAYRVFGTNDVNHPGVSRVYRMKDILIGGKIELIRELDSPFPEFDFTPAETRRMFEERGWKTVVGFQTRNVPHLGHEYLHKVCLNFLDGLFINPIIGKKKQGDFKDEVIIEAYKTLIDNYYVPSKVVLGILKTEMRYAGPKEAIFHAIIRKNFGCTHFIVGRDHAGVGNYYPLYAAQEIFNEFPDLGITPIFYSSVFFCSRCNGVVSEKVCPHSEIYRTEFSGTMIREMLRSREELPIELIRPEVANVIKCWKNPFVESA